MKAVSDAGPLHYLVLIEQIEVLGVLFEAASISNVVHSELAHPRAPSAVQTWIASPPPWLSTVQLNDSPPLPGRVRLHPGEQTTIDLAVRLRPGLVLIDDRAGVTVGRARGFQVTGTLGVLYRAATAGLVDLPTVLARLATTNFHHTPGLLKGLLARFKAEQPVP